MEKATEKVQCGICGRDTTVKAWESILCECGVRIWSTPELRAKIVELDKQALALRVEAMTHQRELFYRERRRTMVDVKGNPIADNEFWKGVHGRPREDGPGSTATKPQVVRKVKGDETLL